MKILITNDDGINAKGIRTLAKKLAKKHEIVIVAPREEKSAASHSISIHQPIRIKEEKIEGINCRAYSVVGTPADCTQIGLGLLKEKVDIVISGINRGYNLGTDILYSGTVSAAIEAAIYGVPAISVSMEVDFEKVDEDYEIAANWLVKILDKVDLTNIEKNTVLNLNVPNRLEEDIKGLKICKIGRSTYTISYTLLEDNEDKVYKQKGVRNKIEEKDSDLYYSSLGYVTLTPLHYDFTNFNLFEDIDKQFNDNI